ncbi:MAG: hypothetical protein AB7P02_05295, partial [Alphaproteobacteria bacterium]
CGDGVCGDVDEAATPAAHWLPVHDVDDVSGDAADDAASLLAEVEGSGAEAGMPAGWDHDPVAAPQLAAKGEHVSTIEHPVVH